jgi:putative aldouronate transport system permease protein
MENVKAYKGRGLVPVIWKEKFSYLMILPAFIATGVFCYWPMYGIILAFKNYRISKGILGSPWMDTYGFGWFKIMFRDPDFLKVIRNTVEISFSKLVLGTFFCILFALLLNELRSEKYKRTIQSVMYLPHFLSWVIMASIIYNIFTTSGGLFSKIVTGIFHGQTVQILANQEYFRPLVYISMIWKEVGFGTIIYLAAIAGVNPELYESAIIDGASRFKRILFITLPSIKSTIIILLILNLSSIMSAGFDQIFNLYSPQVLKVGDIIDTYVYRHGVVGLEFSYSTAIDLFKQVINITLLVIVNSFAKFLGEEGIY